MSTVPAPFTIAIDFDGVLSAYRLWTGEVPTCPPTEGARDFVAWLREQGARVVVFSCRASTLKGRRGIEDWCRLYGIEVDEVTCAKPHAKVYIDDRAARFTGSWDDMRAIVLSPDPVKAEPESPVRFAAGVDLATAPDYTAHVIAEFDPKCGTCAISIVGVVPNGVYEPCGHKAPGMEHVE